MINSSGTGYDTQTGGWTNLEQPEACGGAASANEVRSLITTGCGGSLSGFPLYSGSPLTTVGGMLMSAYSPFFNCWMNDPSLDANGDGVPDKPWAMTLPLIECNGSNPGPCNMVVGAINVEVLWIRHQNDPHFNDVPTNYHYADEEISVAYTCPETCTPTAEQPVCASLATEDGRRLCWANFLTENRVVDHTGQPFTVDTAAAGYLQQNIIFKPSCSVAEIASGPGPGPTMNMDPAMPRLVR